jgi:germination protein M
MKREARQDALRKLLLAVWSMVTLVLFFCVILLAREMIEAGQDPADAFLAVSRETEPAPQTAQRPAASVGSREITLFFAASDGRGLAPETRMLELSNSTWENCRAALEALIAGPDGEGLSPVFPPPARIRGLYLLDDGELVVDFSRELLSEHILLKSAAMEALMVYGTVDTLTQAALQSRDDTAVRRVRFMIEGSAPEELFPAHLDLSEPIEAGRRRIETAPGPAAHG